MRTLMIALSVAFLLVLCLSGCVNERQALYVAADTYATTVGTLAEYAQAGIIDAEKIRELEPYRQVAYVALMAWRDAVAAGAPAAEQINTFNDAILKLIEARRAVAGKAGA